MYHRSRILKFAPPGSKRRKTAFAVALAAGLIVGGAVGFFYGTMALVPGIIIGLFMGLLWFGAIFAMIALGGKSGR